jgi:hypothetical protein
MSVRLHICTTYMSTQGVYRHVYMCHTLKLQVLLLSGKNFRSIKHGQEKFLSGICYKAVSLRAICVLKSYPSPDSEPVNQQ